MPMEKVEVVNMRDGIGEDEEKREKIEPERYIYTDRKSCMYVCLC